MKRCDKLPYRSDAQIRRGALVT